MLAIISHDAGGAEILSSYVLKYKPECIFVLEGPALNIFQRKLGSVTVMSLEEALSKAEEILCGSSWQSDLEFVAIKKAKMLDIPSVTFLDHWVNYEERFIRNDECFFPDEIWVGDKTAELLAKKIFASTPIRFIENPYFLEIRNELAKLPANSKEHKNKIAILYVCEPVREPAFIQYGDENYLGYTEEDALRYFLNNIDLLCKSVESIVIRPHPSEKNDKYHWVKDEFDLPVKDGGSISLLEEIAECDIVIGCESMAMVVGLLADKRVISSIPAGGRECVLPHAEIEHLQELI